ncbi:MAG: GNAT family N-acetyltransferase [Idiomarina sp.]|nr:GNAT family N-acetyltransferase [Idiomarina sp.]
MSSFRQHFRNLIIIAADQDWPEYAGAKLQLSTANLSSYRQHLGEQYNCIFFSAATTFHADAFLAISGTLAGGGLLVLQAPVHSTPAWQRLLHYLQQQGINTQLTSPADAQHYCDSIPDWPRETALTPTAEQSAALTELQQLHTLSQVGTNGDPSNANTLKSCVVVINAPRGRGKSTLLGLWLNTQPELNAVVCSPSKRQAAQILATATQPVAFLPPDRLLEYTPQAQQWLIIDEAASIPSHILATVAERWQRLVLATTTEGYESAGRGFLLRLQTKLPNYFQQVLNIELHQPIRWRAGDPLEAALNACFCLQRTPSTSTTADSSKEVAQGSNAMARGSQQQLKHSLRYRICHAAELSHAELSEAFSLLTTAHYQTSPNDLQLLLNDSAQQLVLQYQQQQIIGVCWIASEGPLAAELVTPIYEGKRRPPGNLLPQTMVFHLREPSAATLPMLRIVRIALQPELQGHGFGSLLLNSVCEFAETQAALIGTSFGGSESLHNFWYRAGFQPVRLGLQKDAASGMRSLVYVKPCSGSTETAKQAHSLTIQLVTTFAATLIGYAAAAPAISNELHWLLAWRDNLPSGAPVNLPIQQFLADFAAGFIPFAVLQPMLATVLLQSPQLQRPDNLLMLAALSSKSLSALAKEHGFSGKSEFITELRTLAQPLTQHLTLR